VHGVEDDRILALAPTETSPGMKEIALLRGKTAPDGRPTAYVCQNYVCSAPVHRSEELLAQIA